MHARWPRVAAWGTLAALLVAGAIVIATRDRGPLHGTVAGVAPREFALSVTPRSVRTGTTTTLALSAADGAAQIGGETHAWIVRDDLAWLTHVALDAGAPSSSLALPLRATEPGAYRIVLESSLPEVGTLGTGSFSAAGAPGDAPPRELSAAREGFRVTLSSIPDAGAIVAGVPVTLTYAVERTDTPIRLDERDGARGTLVAFREGAGFARGAPMAPELLPSPAASTFSVIFPERGRYRLFFEFGADGKSYAEAEWIDVR